MHYPAVLVSALVDAIVRMYWRKKEIRSLLLRSGAPWDLVVDRDWGRAKLDIVSPIVNALNSRPDGARPLGRLLKEVLSRTDGRHLLWGPDGWKRKCDAERAVRRLHLLAQAYTQSSTGPGGADTQKDRSAGCRQGPRRYTVGGPSTTAEDGP